MLVVSNTSPILNLAIVGRLELFRGQLGEVVIPRAVETELRADEALPGSDAVATAIANGWLRVQPVSNTLLVRALRADLDAGEAEAIALATEVNADLILLDEREARQKAFDVGPAPLVDPACQAGVLPLSPRPLTPSSSSMRSHLTQLSGLC